MAPWSVDGVSWIELVAEMLKQAGRDPADLEWRANGPLKKSVFVEEVEGCPASDSPNSRTLKSQGINKLVQGCDPPKLGHCEG